MRCRPALAAILVVFGVAPVGADSGAPPLEDISLARLMQRLSEVPGLRAHFEETRYVALLREPLRSEGVLYFDPPDRLARHTLRPSRASLVIDGERMLLRDAVGEDSVDLQANQAASQFVGNFVVLFSGNLEALESRYRIEFASQGESWQMVLRPRSRAMSALIESIALDGVGIELRDIAVLEVGGDRTTTRFDEIDTAHVLAPDEARSVFSLEGPSPGE